uniref:Uncharacterized protein n=1 Tax=Anguilla anguilla TaxID=7936 RepID=A0A0E9R9E3_ANGAN
MFIQSAGESRYKCNTATTFCTLRCYSAVSHLRFVQAQFSPLPIAKRTEEFDNLRGKFS